MSRLLGYFLACALGAGAAIALASCGSGGPDLLPGNTAREISANLDTVEELAGEGNCVGAQDAAQQIGDQIAELGGVDERLKAALREGAARLNEVVVANCAPETEESIAPASIPETTEETTEKAEKKPKKKPAEEEDEEEEEETETTPTEPTTTTPTPPGPPTTVPPEVSGGAEAPPGGVGPGAAEGGD